MKSICHGIHNYREIYRKLISYLGHRTYSVSNQLSEFCLPSLYLLVLVAIMICPWLLSALGALSALSGRLLASRVPIFIIAANFYNPLELGANLASSGRLCPAILRKY